MSWYETFFQGEAVASWVRVVTPEWTSADADFLEKTLATPKGAKLLDVACGSGRHSIELSRRGYRTTGVDLSEEFLAIARKDAPELEWIDCDLRKLDFEDARFDGAFQIGNSFSYLERPEMAIFLASLAKSLKPGARFVFDTGGAAESVLPKTESQRWYDLGDSYMLSQGRYDARRGEHLVDYTFLRGGTGETKRCVYRVDTVAEIERQLGAAGFDLIETWSDQSGKPFELRSLMLIGVAVRRT